MLPFHGAGLQEYKQVLALIQSNILDTDIATHLRKMSDINQMGSGEGTRYQSVAVALPEGYSYTIQIVHAQ